MTRSILKSNQKFHSGWDFVLFSWTVILKMYYIVRKNKLLVVLQM